MQSMDTTLEVVGLMAHPLASIMGNILYIILEVVDLMVHPFCLNYGLSSTVTPFLLYEIAIKETYNAPISD